MTLTQAAGNEQPTRSAADPPGQHGLAGTGELRHGATPAGDGHQQRLAGALDEPPPAAGPVQVRATRRSPLARQKPRIGGATRAKLSAGRTR